MRFATLLIGSLIATTGAMFISFGCGGGGTGGSTSSTGTGGGSSGTGTGAGSTGTGMGGSTSGTGGMSSSSGTAGSGTGTGTSSGTSSGVHPIAPCQNQVYKCGDGIDNDGDGLIDSDDPDCLGPCDNSEDSYYPDIPGQNSAPCKADCYFDNDTGPGNDDCYWDHGCDPHEVPPNYYPESVNGAACAYDPNTNISGTNKTCAELYQAQSQICHDICGPLTPNGCDCFGCCELPAGGGKYVYLGSVDGAGNGTCTIADVADPDKCQPCLPVAACLNTCGTCELCLGKTELPPECFPDAGVPDSGIPDSGMPDSGSSSSSSSSSSGGSQCSDGVIPCGLPGQLPCPGGYYCITGCCQKIPG